MKRPNNIIHHAGRVVKTEFEGVIVERPETIIVLNFPQVGMVLNVPCAPYDEHFVFEVPKSREREGRSPYLCTCGSAAVIKDYSDPRAMLFVCHFHAQYGYHTTSVLNKDDFPGGSKEKLDPDKGRQWLI